MVLNEAIVTYSSLGYAGLFAAAGLVCMLSLARTRHINDAQTRFGLVWLLLLSGGWAFAHVGYLVLPSPVLQEVSYVLGLVVGFAAVGPWLYFCSAYTGRSLHLHRQIRIAAVAIFIVVIGVKLTNPLHGWYYTTEVTDTIPTLAISHLPAHWVTMGLAYALAVVGFFMLFELFASVGTSARPLYGVVTLAGLPVIFDVFGAATPWILNITYSPLGVAAFAVGVCWVYFERFESVQLAGESDHPMILLDDTGQIRQTNRSARLLFPDLKNAVGTHFSDVLPEFPDVTHEEDSIELVRDGESRYYAVRTNPFSSDYSRLGTVVLLTDVTEEEQYRMRLELQNQRLEQFAAIISHDLRNPLNVAAGRLELATKDNENEHLDAIAAAHDRMGELIEDVLTLARQGEPIDETAPVDIVDLALACWEMVDTPDGTLHTMESRIIEADPERLHQLFENLFRNAVTHGGANVSIRVGGLDNGFYVEDNGPGIPPEERSNIFDWGYTTGQQGTGLGLAIVHEIVRGHGWEIHITESVEGGARFEITGVRSRT